MQELLEKLAKIAEQTNMDDEPKQDSDKEQIDMNTLFRITCPVHKINFKVESPQTVLGMYLMVSFNYGTDVYEKVLKLAETKDLTDNTMLVFSDRHKAELAMIVYGMLMTDFKSDIGFTNAAKTVSRFYRHSMVSGILYGDFLKSIKTLDFTYFPPRQSRYAKDLMRLLPFITYKDIDDLCHEAIDYFQAKVSEENAKSGTDAKSDNNSKPTDL